MSFSSTITDYVNAAFAGLYVVTSEPDEAARELANLCQQANWGFSQWDVAQGVHPGSQLPPGGSGDPMFPINTPPQKKEGQETHLVALHNYHKYLAQPLIFQTLFNRIKDGKVSRNILVILAPTSGDIPIEIQRVMPVLEHPLPDRAALDAIARDMGDDSLDDQRAVVILDAAAGLTRYEAEGAFALSLARQGRIDPESVWELKVQTLRKSGLLTLHRGGERFAALGGLTALKDFCTAALAHNQR